MGSNTTVMGPGSAVRPGSVFELHPEKALDELRSPHAPAFDASCADRPGDSFFALVSDPALPPRYELIEKLASMQLGNLLTPVAWGPVTLGLANFPPNSYATLFERPRGARVMNLAGEPFTPFSGDEILRRILPPLVGTLRAFHDTRITHRAIRPANMFFRGIEKQLVFGDAVSSPPGSAQPAVFETVEGAMALPHCRGAGTPSDDLYALGVSIVVLLLGRDPTSGTDPRELLHTKIERGSFTLLVGNSRLPPELIEIIRGLLADEERERWTIEDVENWLLGRRLKPRQQNPSGIIATRPFEVGGRGYYTARGVAYAFAADPSGAGRSIRSGDFDIWLQRSLADQKRSVAVAAVRADIVEGKGSIAQDLRLAARTCIALDPAAPIRYGDFAAAVDSFGYALAAAFNGKGSLQTIGEVLTARLPQAWLSAQNGLRPELLAMSVAKPFDTLRRLAEDPRPGSGLERLLYELNPRLHCLSPVLGDDYIVNTDAMLEALERAAARGALGDTLIDRHAAAFIASQERQIGREGFDLLGGTVRQRTLGALYILAHLQTTHGPATVPALGKMIAAQAASLVDMFHSRRRRARLASEIAKLAGRGSLSELYWLLNGSNEHAHDLQDFAAAQREHAALITALANLRRGDHTRPAAALDLGGRAGFIVAGWCAVAASLMAVLRIW